MKKLMALVLSLGLVLLGTAPVMAAGQAAKAAPPAQQGQVMQLVVPDGVQQTANSPIGQILAFHNQCPAKQLNTEASTLTAIPIPNGANISNTSLEEVEGSNAVVIALIVLCFLFGPCGSTAQ